MKRKADRIKLNLFLGITLLCAVGCSDSVPAEESTEYPDIFPDYKETVIPCNIAPMNFMIAGAEKIRADFYLDDEKLLSAEGRNALEFQSDEWKDMMLQAKGNKLNVSVSVWNEKYPEGIRYRSFALKVSPDSISSMLAYRLIPPGYVLWNEMGIYQRSLESFDEYRIISNKENHRGCVNCHSFHNYSPDLFLFHARGKNGCSVLVEQGVPRRLELDKLPPNYKGTYPFWHPDGRFVAFANCDTHQAFYGNSQNKVEVYDLVSDLMIYDRKENKVITDRRFTENKYWETFPTFSPDGKWLYLCRAKACKMPMEYSKLKYAIIRIGFNEDNGTLGDIIDTLYLPEVNGGSASFPRISPDGQHLLFTESDCGTFPIWHKQADLKMINLLSLDSENTDILNSDDVDSYHSWDKNGKWIVFSSRRIDGRYTRLFIAHFDKEKGFSKPFLLPQESPLHNVERMYSYNIPEFILGKVLIKESFSDLFN